MNIEKNYQTNFEECFQAKSCPVCRAIEHAREVYFRWYALEYYHSPQAILSLAKGGFCLRHAQFLVSLGNEVSLAYRYIATFRRQALDKIQHQLSDATEESSPSILGKWLKSGNEDNPFSVLHASDPCPACMSEENARAVTVIDTGGFLQESAAQVRYQAIPLLCWPHLIDVIDSAKPDVVDFLIECHRQELIQLEKDFEEYFRKTDYRYSDEPKGEEQEAWRKALRFFFRVDIQLSQTEKADNNSGL